jgi:uncharacterized iron-regulated protein
MILGGHEVADDLVTLDPEVEMKAEGVLGAAGKAARAANFVLLGEKHDNEDHHLYQAWIVTALVLGHRQPAVAFEQLDTDQEPKVDDWRSRTPHDYGALAAVTAWDKSGWPPFHTYEPIFRAADGLVIVAANVPHATARRLVREGIGALEGATRIGLDQPFPPELDASLRRELQSAHCGMAMPPKIEDGMVLAERARDATMADTLRGYDREGGVVLIAGTGHTRIDRGAPLYLARVAPTRSRVSIAFVEVDAAETDPAKYGAQWGVDAPPFDFVVFTPRANDDDPCAGMRK